jgi:predicted XRE-type DNA-binding protein/quercetin dioxygenase-like cupin family protein
MITPNQHQTLESQQEAAETYLRFSTDQTKKSSKQNKQSLRHLRVEKNLTQKEISELLNITRSQYQRLENKSADKFTVGEVEMIAQALSISSEEVIKKLSSRQKEKVVRGAFSKPAFLVELAQGVKIASFCEQPKDYFVGTMEILPKSTLFHKDSPKAQKIYYSVFKGEVLMTIDKTKEILLKKDDYVILENVIHYEIYNPHSIYPAEIMVTASSSSFLLR